MRFAVTGGRDFRDRAVAEDWLCRIKDDGRVVLMHGNARGLDRLAERLALNRGWGVAAFSALWGLQGKSAGFIRNGRILDRQPAFLLAFPGGRGTADMVAQAKARGIPVFGPHPEAQADGLERYFVTGEDHAHRP